MDNLSIQEIINELELKPHPEGGYYKETYRSNGTIGENSLPDNMQGYRRYSTSIHYLLKSDQKSAFHRIKSDEIWHFHSGDPVEIFEINASGELETTVIGLNIREKQQLTHVVLANRWFAARPLNSAKKQGFSLMSCNVAPGFDPLDFEMANQTILKEQIGRYPALEELTMKVSTTNYFPS